MKLQRDSDVGTGGRRGVEESEILDAALAIIRRGGLDHFTVRSLCNELGVTQPYIYNRFANKQELVSRVVDRLLDLIPRPSADEADWDERLYGVLRDNRELMLQHGRIALNVSRPEEPSAVSLGLTDWVIGVLLDGGLTPLQAVRGWHLLNTYFYGNLVLSSSGVGTSGQPMSRASFLAHHEDIAAQYPNLRRCRAALRAAEDDDEMRTAVEVIIAGLRELTVRGSRRRARRSPRLTRPSAR